jgi:hypothetical protein
MEKFGIDQRKVVSEAFNSIVEAFEKDIKNKTEETKIDITFREDNSIFIEAKAAIDKVYIKFEASVVNENSKTIIRAKEICGTPTFFIKEIGRINLLGLYIKGEDASFILQKNMLFSSFFDGDIRNAIYKLIVLNYRNTIGKELPKRVLLDNDMEIAKKDGKTYFREVPLATIYDSYGNATSSNDKDYEYISEAFSIEISQHRTLQKFREFKGLVVLDSEKGFHIEAEGFNPEENMW